MCLSLRYQKALLLVLLQQTKPAVLLEYAYVHMPVVCGILNYFSHTEKCSEHTLMSPLQMRDMYIYKKDYRELVLLSSLALQGK